MHASTKQSTADLTNDTIVGIFPDEHTARDVSDDLISQGFGRGNIHISSDAADLAELEAARTQLHANAAERGGGIMGWLRSLFGSDRDEEHGHYAEAVRRGRCVVAVTVDRANRDRVADIMNDHDALDIDREVASYRETGYTKYDPNAGPYRPPEAAKTTAPERNREPDARAGDTRSVPVIQEELEVGKRVIQRGGVRVYTHVTQKPVEEKVTLRDEKVTVERRPAGRDVSEAEATGLRDQTIEVTESAEQPVVSKRSRVVEEVVIGKTVTERQETIRDTVRRTDVNVEKIPTGESPNAPQAGPSYDEDFRKDFESRYASLGEDYQAYAPAYEYGYRMAGDPRYTSRNFGDAEPELKADYLRYNPNGNWDRTRGAVQYGWEKASERR